MSIENLIDSHRYSLDRSAFFNEFNEFMNGLGIDERSSQAPNATRPPSASFTYGPNQAMVLAAILPEQGQLTYENRTQIIDALGRSIFETEPDTSPKHEVRAALKFLMNASFKASVFSPTSQADLYIPGLHTVFKLNEETYTRARHMLLWGSGHIPSRNLVKLAIYNSVRTPPVNLEKFLDLRMHCTAGADSDKRHRIEARQSVACTLTVPANRLMSKIVENVMRSGIQVVHVKDMHGLNRFGPKQET